jgi:ribosome maturation factor RimP
MNPMVSQIWPLAESLCRSESMELVHMEFHREHGGRTLRLFIDRPGGVTLDDCANISRQLSDLLDVKMETNMSYRLEVSSPGLDRPLGKLNDFNTYQGQRVKIRSGVAIGGQKHFTGILEGVEGTDIRLQINQQAVIIPFDQITKAQVLASDGI